MTAQFPESVTSNASRKKAFSRDSPVSHANPWDQQQRLMACRAWTPVSDRWHRPHVQAQHHQLTALPAHPKHHLEQVGNKKSLRNRSQLLTIKSLLIFRNFVEFRNQRSRHRQIGNWKSRRNSPIHWWTAVRFGCLVRCWVWGSSRQEWWKCRWK